MNYARAGADESAAGASFPLAILALVDVSS